MFYVTLFNKINQNMKITDSILSIKCHPNLLAHPIVELSPSQLNILQQNNLYTISDYNSEKILKRFNDLITASKLVLFFIIHYNADPFQIYPTACLMFISWRLNII